MTHTASSPPHVRAQVQSGVARTGRWWGHQHLTDAQPDLLLFAKGIASGVPFAGVSARPHLYDKMSPGMMVGGVGGGVFVEVRLQEVQVLANCTLHVLMVLCV